MGKTVRVGSRESCLAVKQAEIVMNAVKKSNNDIEFKLITIKTKGDKILNQNLDKIGGKGLFIKELEEALINSEIDFAVHSYKDIPYEESEELPIVALSERASPFDALVLPRDAVALDTRKPVGSSSLRRSIQFRELYNGVETAPIRGNVQTRLSKLDNGEYSAIILAHAGLNRLNLGERISRIFSAEEMIPSASQGILAVQGRKGVDYSYLSGFHSRKSEYASKAERRFLQMLGGGCSSPVAAYAEIHGTEIRLIGMYADNNGRTEKSSLNGSLENAEQIGEALAKKLLKRAVE